MIGHFDVMLFDEAAESAVKTFPCKRNYKIFVACMRQSHYHIINIIRKFKLTLTFFSFTAFANLISVISFYNSASDSQSMISGINISELETYKTKVAELEQAAGDNADVKKQLDDLKAQIAEEKRLADEKAADDQLTQTIKAAFPKDKKFVNEFTEAAYISQIKAEMGKPENKGKGITEIFGTLTKDKAGIFENPNEVSDMNGFSGGGFNEVDDAKLRRVMGLPPKKE